MSRKKLKAAKLKWENMGHRPVDANDYSIGEDWGCVDDEIGDDELGDEHDCGEDTCCCAGQYK